MHSVLIAIYKCLIRQGELSRDDLMGLCAPISLFDREPQKQALQTLRTWLEFGLFEEVDGKVRISKQYKIVGMNQPAKFDALPRIARSVVLARGNNEKLFADEGSRSADFTRALCWILAQNVYTVPGGSHDEIAKLEKDSGFQAFQNQERWAAFKAWAMYLGFGWRINNAKGDQVMIVDPSVAVREVLSDVFPDVLKLPQDIFFSRLASALPIVDGGQYRQLIEEKLPRDRRSPTPSRFVSTSLSRALERLRISGILSLEDLSDAKNRTLIGRTGMELRKVSHIVWHKG
jgi:hypothetical protein